MNTSIAQKYLDLIAGLRSYIEQEHPKGSWITTDATTYAYFLEFASKMIPKVKQPPIATAKTIVNSIEKAAQSTRSPRSSQADSNDKTTLPLSPPAPSSSIKKPQAVNIEPQPAKAIKPQPLSKTFMREAPSVPTRPDFTELHTFFKKQLPAVELSDTITDDSAAKALASRWKVPSSEIIILSFSELANEQTFIANLANALNQCLASTKVLSARKIEDEKGWEKLLKAEKLRLVIASNYNLHTLPELLKHFHEDATGKHTLGNVKVYLLSDLSLYMQQPSLKASLWKTLCQLYQ